MERSHRRRRKLPKTPFPQRRLLKNLPELTVYSVLVVQMTRAWVWRVLRETGNPSRALAKHGKASGGASYSGGGGSCGGGLGQAAAAAEKPKDYSDRSGKEKRRGKGSPRARIRMGIRHVGASAMELGGS